MSLTFRLPLLVLTLLLVRVVSVHAADMPRPRRAVADDLALAVRFLPDGTAVSAGEPVIARVDIINESADTVEVHTGSGEVPALCVEVRREGRALATTPRPERRPDGLCGFKDIRPGATYSVFAVITALCELAQPGRYTIRAELVDWMTRHVLCEGAAEVTVQPFDAGQLEGRIEQVYHSTDLTPAVCSRAICSVRQDIALPYLDAMATAQGSIAACLAIRRIGTERASALLEALASREDRVGEAAREAREMELGTSMWDVLGW